MSENTKKKIGVVLAGHGAPATDCPPRLVGELMGLEWSGQGASDAAHQRIVQLDAQIRNWPRTPANDPYKAGLEKVAAVLKPLLGEKLFAIGYNEFCAPSVEEAITQVVRQGAARVLVIPTMLTPGGLHSELDIPRSIEKARASHAGISIEYLWPFDLGEISRLLAGQIERVCR